MEILPLIVLKNNNESESEEEEFDESILETLGLDNDSDSNSYNNIINIIDKFKNRRIYLFGDICTYNILVVVNQIHILESRDPNSDIELYINSGGGFVIDCLALIDTMDASRCDFKVTVLGMAASAACLIASNGTPGKRYAGRNSEFMFHEVSGPVSEMKLSELEYYGKEAKRVQEKFNRIFTRNTGLSSLIMKKEFYRPKDKFLTAVEARKFGIVDHVLTPRRKKK